MRAFGSLEGASSLRLAAEAVAAATAAAAAAAGRDERRDEDTAVAREWSRSKHQQELKTHAVTGPLATFAKRRHTSAKLPKHREVHLVGVVLIPDSGAP